MSGTTDGDPQGGTDDTIVVADTIDPSTAEDTGAEQTQEAAEAEAPAEEQEGETKPPFWQKLIAEAAFKEREAKRQMAAIAEENERLRKGLPQGADAIPATEIERRITERIEAARFAEDCNAIAEVGEKAFKDFGTTKATYDLIGTSTEFLEGIAEIGRTDGKEAAARVYYELGKNPEEAYRIMNMKPAAMAVQLSKMASAKPALKPVSRAPAPITPIGANSGRAGGMPSPDDDAAYRAWFLKERAKRA